MFKEDISFKVDGLVIRGKLFLPRSSGVFPSVCLCHGIPAKPYDPKDKGYEEIAHKFCQEGFAAFIFNFRGSGESEGDFDIAGWARDLAGALDIVYRYPGIDRKRFAVIGSSAGAAVAVYHTGRDSRVTHLVTLACPASFGFITNPARAEEFLKGCRQVGIIRSKDFPRNNEEWLQGFKEVNPLSWIEKVSPRPLLLVHGDADELIPPEDARRLFEKAGEPKELELIPEAGHRLRTEPRVIALCLEWLKKMVLQEKF